MRFPDYRLAYEGINLPNIAVFKEQIDLLKEFMVKATPDAEQRANMDYMLALGEMFALIVYGQLIVENCKIYNIENDLIDQIFGLLVTDFSHFAMTQIAKSGNNGEQEKYLWQMLKKPAINAAREMRIWTDHVEVLNGSYTMNP
ncbi:MAG: hypothetical protein EG826_04725 [Deltaproteobacteria bacterium]|nr:hypothetical protein [Deltaproteobacteria bacterium]